MAPRFLSSKTFLIACVAAALSWSIPAQASMIVPEPWWAVTAGDPLPVSITWYQGGDWGGLESFHAQLYYDASILRPQRVTFIPWLGDPDMRSYRFDAASGWFIADEFGKGDATTIVDPGSFWLFPEPSPGQGTFHFGEWSFIYDELEQLNGMMLATVTFDTLQPGTSSIDLSYTMNGVGVYSSTTTTTVNPVPVPEPSTLFMMLAAAPWALARMRHRAAK